MLDGRQIVGTVLVDGFAARDLEDQAGGWPGGAEVGSCGSARPRRWRRNASGCSGSPMLSVGAGGADRGGPPRLAAPAHSNRLRSFSTARLFDPNVSSAWKTPFTPITEPVGGGAEVSLNTVSVPVASFTW